MIMTTTEKIFSALGYNSIENWNLNSRFNPDFSVVSKINCNSIFLQNCAPGVGGDVSEADGGEGGAGVVERRHVGVGVRHAAAVRQRHPLRKEVQPPWEGEGERADHFLSRLCCIAVHRLMQAGISCITSGIMLFFHNKIKALPFTVPLVRVTKWGTDLRVTAFNG